MSDDLDDDYIDDPCDAAASARATPGQPRRSPVEVAARDIQRGDVLGGYLVREVVYVVDNLVDIWTDGSRFPTQYSAGSMVVVWRRE